MVACCIVGAGPIGSYAGYLLSKAGVDNIIFEEHSKIGWPEQCSGLVNEKIREIVRIPLSLIKNRLKGAVFHIGNAEFTVKSHKDQAYLLDRMAFDQHMASLAENAGTTIKLTEKYIYHYDNHIKTSEGKYDFSCLIGADGGSSKVAKNSGLWQDREFYFGLQHFVKNPGIQKDMVHVFLDNKYSNGFFSWIIPENEEIIKIGLLSTSHCRDKMKAFMNDKLPDCGKIIKTTGGIVPKYKKISLVNKNVFLAGDAGLLVKGTTGGGLISGLLCTKKLAECIIDKKYNYEQRISPLRRNLWMHSKIRKKIDKLDDADKMKALNALKGTENIFEKYGDMDYLGSLAFMLALKRPELIKWVV